MRRHLFVLLALVSPQLLAQDSRWCRIENGAATAQVLRPTMNDIDSSGKVQYRSLAGDDYVLNQFSGRHVAILLPDAWVAPGGLTVEERRTLLDRLDWFYELYNTIVGREPAGEGLLPIYVVRVVGAVGLGRIGSKWVEISSDAATLNFTKDDLRAGGLPSSIYVHEMAHNFDVYETYLGYGPDPPHTWTSLLLSIAQIYGRCGQPPENVPEWIMDPPRRIYQEYIDDPRASWAGCVRTGVDCTIGVSAAAAWIAITLRVADLHGIDSMPRFLAAVGQLAAGGPAPNTPEEKENLHVEALAAAVQQDLGCYVDFWRWYASPALRAKMSSTYGPNRFCEDRDSDGFSPLAGDCNDTNPAVHSQAAELLNGIDDDCDDQVDDPLYVEPPGGDFPEPLAVHFPSRIVGALSSPDDVDSFTFQLPAAGDIRLSLWPFSPFPFEFDVIDSTGAVVSTGPALGNHHLTLAAGTWKVRVRKTNMMLPSLPSSSARYELDLFSAPPRASEWGSVAPPVLQGDLMRLTARTLTLKGALKSPTEVRFWISKLGFVGSAPYAPTVTFDWRIPADLALGTYGYRAQAYADSIPVTDLTAPVWFSTQRPPRRRAVSR